LRSLPVPGQHPTELFRAKQEARIKLVFWDGTGLCLLAKGLEDRIFRWPKIEHGVMRLSAAQLSALHYSGIGWAGGLRRCLKIRCCSVWKTVSVVLRPF
jgi:transposase